MDDTRPTLVGTLVRLVVNTSGIAFVIECEGRSIEVPLTEAQLADLPDAVLQAQAAQKVRAQEQAQPKLPSFLH